MKKTFMLLKHLKISKFKSLQITIVWLMFGKKFSLTSIKSDSMTEEENENSTSDCHEETGIFCPKVMKLELNYFFSIFF